MTENPDRTLSLDDAVDMWMAEEPEADDTMTEEAEADTAPEEDTAAEDEAEAVGDDDEDAGTDDAEEGDDDPEIEIDTPKGKQAVKLSELQKGYLRQADYTRKTMEVAEARKAVEQESGQLSQIKQQLTEALQFWAVPTEQEPNWTEMAQKLDPREFNARRVQWEQRQRQAEQAREQYRALQQYEQQETLRREQERLLEAFPEWRDPAAFQTAAQRMARHAEAYGLTPQEIGSIVDHRFMRVLHDAAAYREMKAKQPETTKKVVKPVQGLKPGSKPNKGALKDAAIQQKRAKLRQTGRIDDAVDLLLGG